DSAAGGTGDGAVDAPQVVIEKPLVVALVQQGRVEARPGAVAPPALEAAVDGVPWAVAFGQIAPGGAGAQDPQDAVEYGVVGHPGPAGLAVVAWLGPPRLQTRVLGFGKFVAMHGKPPLGNSPAPELGLTLLYA